MNFEVVDEVPAEACGRSNPVFDGVVDALMNADGKPLAVDIGEDGVSKVLSNVRTRLYRHNKTCKSYTLEDKLYLVLADRRSRQKQGEEEDHPTYTG